MCRSDAAAAARANCLRPVVRSTQLHQLAQDDSPVRRHHHLQHDTENSEQLKTGEAAGAPTLERTMVRREV